MTAVELIKKLQKIVHEHGDLEVRVQNTSEDGAIYGSRDPEPMFCEKDSEDCRVWLCVHYDAISL